MTGVSRRLVTSAVLVLLRAEMPCPVGDHQAPTPTEGALQPNSDDRLALADGFVVVFQVPPAVYPSTGWTGQSTSMMTVRHQIVGAGIQRDQAQGLVDLATSVLLDRADVAPFDFVHDLTVAGHSVMNRRPGNDIPVEPEAGAVQAGAMVDLLVTVT